MFELNLKCQCGLVKGQINLSSVATGNRVVCHCADCQAFANFLTENGSQATRILDEQGGTEVFQVPIAKLKINSGADQLACLRLSPKGLYRWYAGCCQTPIGNSMGPSMPFMGVIHSFTQIEESPQPIKSRDEWLGPVKEYCQTQHALKPVETKPNHPTFSVGVTMGIMFKILYWKTRGWNKPSSFFNSKGEPLGTVKILGR